MIDTTSASRPQGWCPSCGLRSVQVVGMLLVCTSPQCAWEAERGDEIERTVFADAPILTDERRSELAHALSGVGVTVG